MVDGEIDPKITDNIPDRQGMDALAVYALLHCSQSMRDDRIKINSPTMRELVEHLKHFGLNATEEFNRPDHIQPFARASALAIYNRPEDHETLAGDLAWLMRAEEDGAFTLRRCLYPQVAERTIRRSRRLLRRPMCMVRCGWIRIIPIRNTA